MNSEEVSAKPTFADILYAGNFFYFCWKTSNFLYEKLDVFKFLFACLQFWQQLNIAATTPAKKLCVTFGSAHAILAP